jgi:outer membrane protein OmpA-like peptidoglycan-associated protein
MRWLGEIGVQVRYTTGTYIIVGRSLVEEARRKIPDAEVLPAMFAVSNFEEWASNHSRISDVRYIAEEILGWDAPFPTVEYERARVAKLRELFNRGALVMLHQPIRYIPGYKRKKPKVEAPVLGPEDAPTKTWFEVKLVDEFGDPIDGIEVVFTQGSAKEKVKTNGNGVARWKDVAGSSFASVRVANAGALRTTLEPRWARGGRRVEIEESDATLHVRSTDGTRLDGEAPRRVVIVRAAYRARLIGFYFDTAKCFLLPAAMKGIRGVAKLYERHPEAEVLVVGHTDRAGAEAYNDKLSLERARSVVAFLTDDIEAWVAWFDAGKPAEKRWGTLEVQLMLSALPEGGPPFYPGKPNGAKDAATRGAVKAFQTWSNETRGTSLAVDGNAGSETRRALVEAYMALDGTSLPKGVTATAHGAGESFPQVATADGVANADNRRVEIFVFDDGVHPPPPGDILPPGSSEYPDWVGQVLDTSDVEQQGCRVRVVDDEGGVVAGARVRLEGPHQDQGVTDGAGLVTFMNLVAGEYVAHAERDGYVVGATPFVYPPDPLASSRLASLRRSSVQSWGSATRKRRSRRRRTALLLRRTSSSSSARKRSSS